MKVGYIVKKMDKATVIFSIICAGFLITFLIMAYLSRYVYEAPATTMKLYRETAIRKQGDKPTIAMLDLWQSLSVQTIGVPIEVMVGNRKEQTLHPQLRSYPGKINTELPEIFKGKVRLIVWLESLSDIKYIIITHEIGHWILKLRGFQPFMVRGRENSEIEIFLNSMAEHPPLYALQRSIGHEPQAEIDSRCLHNIKLFSKVKEAQQREVRIRNALMLADDIFNSEENRQLLINVLTQRHPNTLNLLRKLIELESSYDLLVPDQNLNFREQVIEVLELGQGWNKRDEVKNLSSLVKQATKQSQQSKP